jgi:hypothetical protein
VAFKNIVGCHLAVTLCAYLDAMNSQLIHNLSTPALEQYRVESSHPIVGPLVPVHGFSEFLLCDRTMAVVIAAKSITHPGGHEIRVVDVRTGEVTYRKTAAFQSNQHGDF